MTMTKKYEAKGFSSGGYAFIPSTLQYSGGVMAEKHYSLHHVRLTQPVPMEAGFEIIKRKMIGAGRPLTALCACELRAPTPFAEDGFHAFNRAYAGILKDWGIVVDGVNPVARSCVCPEINPPQQVSLAAFTYAAPDEQAPPSFVIAGSGEVPENLSNYWDHIVSRGDHSVNGLLQKARWVIEEMEQRMATFGFGWRDTTTIQVYTAHNLHSIIAEIMASRLAWSPGLLWHFARPPIIGIEYEMDCRKIHRNDIHYV